MSVLIPMLAMAVAQGRPSAGDLDGYYNPRREISFSGTVTGKTKGTAPGYAEGISILVKSGKAFREVELGPTWFVGRQQATVKLGDKVRVVGVPLRLDKRQTVVLARQIVRGRSVLALRDPRGNPYWSARPTRVASRGMRREGTRYQGTFGEKKMMVINGQEYVGYTINTENGPVDVAVAPSWYYNNQGYNFNVGDAVTVYGGPATITGANIGLANNGGAAPLNGGSNIRNGGFVGGRIPIFVNSFDYNGGSVFLGGNGGYVYGYGGFRTP